MKRLAIITTHPIQYNAPWFRLLAERKNIGIKVFYTWSQVEHEKKFDPGFGKNISWDIPLLEGYDYTFVQNTAKHPGSKTFIGIRNPTLISEVEAWGPDAVLVFGWKFKSHLKAIRYFHKKVPVLFRGDSHLLGRKEGVKNYLRVRLLKRIFRNIDYALFVGSLNREYFISGGMKEHQLVYCPHTIDLNLFVSTDSTKKAAQSYRETLKIPADALVFLYAGKFEDVKNPMLLINAANRKADRDVHFVFAGNGPLEKELKALAGESVHFMDFQNQRAMPALFEMCDVYVLPSRSETWGLAVNEAMACGKPVLISDACGCAPDLVEEGKTGFTFRSGDAEDLQAKINWLVQHKENLKKMGEEASVKIREWSFEKIVTAIEGLMERL